MKANLLGKEGMMSILQLQCIGIVLFVAGVAALIATRLQIRARLTNEDDEKKRNNGSE